MATASILLDPLLEALLHRGLTSEASDLHLASGYPPTFRVHGRMVSVEQEPLTSEQTHRIIASAMPEELRPQLGVKSDFDFSLELPTPAGVVRFRVNIFRHQGSTGACFRFIPSGIPEFDWMGFPPDLAQRIAAMHNGLVLIAGITGSGKTTTLAAIVDLINRGDDRRIITIEEPIEYGFPKRARSLVTQREVGIDVPTFADGLRYGLRQDPDVILVGEIRDVETARLAISAAETGHLVFTTVHTQDAKGAITRLIDIFPDERQGDIRVQLSLSLRYVISQHLLPSIDPTQKRCLAIEVLVANDPVRAAIRQNKIESIDTAIQTGKKFGMQTLDDALMQLVNSGRIDSLTAQRYAKNPRLFGGA
jgi:twitching motility protein PilT